MSYLETARESLEAIRRRSPQMSDATCAKEVPTPTSDEVAAMSLDDFAQAGLILRVRSAALDSQVLFVSDNVAKSALADEELVVYRASELHKPAVLHPEPHTLRCLHEVKSIFNGVITDVRERDDHDQG
ncbi:MAG: hypothetical protein MPN21_27185 [Thermoanaerobaculia bacterium]|nr:hypothetical protein [Thermoanaerobaculia bacterium]